MVHPTVENRKFSPCERIQGYELHQLIVRTGCCNRLFAACCRHDSFGSDLYQNDEQACHHNQLIFVDGACPNNGRPNARAGLGITMGGEDLSWSIPVDEAMDPRAPRTNQRAELLAAIEGLKKLHDLNIERDHHAEWRNNKDDSTYIVVTDSDYVVKGITQWYFNWKRKNWRTADGKRPTNLDLFVQLDEYITSLESEHITVGFWHVPRAYNHKADELAKRAAAF